MADVTTLLGSGSKLHQTLNCPAAVHLPQTPKPARVLVAGQRGTELHEFCQYAPEEGLKALDRVNPKHHKTCRGIDIPALPHSHTPPEFREMAFAHHGLTGEVRQLPVVNGHRDYGELDKHETPLTIDVVIRGHHMAEVRDLKTGRTQVPPPGVNPQLLHGALCVAEKVSPYAEKFVLAIDTMDTKGQVTPSVAVVDRFDLEQHEGRIRLAQKKALRVVQAIEAGETPEVSPGSWCRWCDAKAACPAQR